MRTINHLIPKIFDVSFVHVHSPNKGKLDLRAVKCIFIGYSSTQKRYKCYHPPSKKILSQQMLHSTRVSPIFLLLIFKGGTSIKEDKDQDSYLIDPPTISDPISILVAQFSEPLVSRPIKIKILI